VRSRRVPDAEITGNDENELTYDQVTAAFERSRPPAVGGSLESEQPARDER
jgi:hypothetical protein